MTNFYEYQIPANASGTNDFCDYPTLGYDANAAWISCDTFSGGTSTFLGNRVFGVPFSQIIKGSLSNYVYFYNIPTDLTATPAYRLSPVIEDGTPQGEFVMATDAGYGVVSSNMTLCAITNTNVVQSGGIPTATCTSVATPLAYDDPVNAPQPGTSSTVYPGFGTKQLAFRDGRIWFAMPISIDCNGTTEDGIWWGDIVPQLTTIANGYPQSVAGDVSAYTENAYWCYSGGVYSYMPTIRASSEADASLVFNLSTAPAACGRPSPRLRSRAASFGCRPARGPAGRGSRPGRS